MKFACGIVLYNPCEKDLRHIGGIIHCFDMSLAYDNSQIKCDCIDFDVVFFTGDNEGLSIPYNKFIDVCREKKIDFLCILDQDTIIDEKSIEEMKEFVKENKDRNTVIYAPRLKGGDNDTWVINSNTFIDVKKFCRYNLRYDDNYFIDRLDMDLCMQLKKKGLKFKINKDVIVAHHIGEGDRGEHSFIRHYYIFRNRLYFNKKYYSYLKRLYMGFLQSIKHFIIIYREGGSVIKMKYCFYALKDYLKSNYGKIK